MRIAIIGGGFYGCYLAFKLKTKFKSKYKIDIFEKNNDLLKEAAINNQWRLHLGFHYPRSKQTIIQKAEHENTIIIKSALIINIGIPTIVVVNIV